METVIVIPLYMTLIGGILWIGELCLARQKLLLADRWAAWTIGTRSYQGNFPNLQTDIANRFFSGTTNQIVGIRPAISVTGGWWSYCSAGPQLTYNLPSWIAGWLDIGTVVWPGAQPQPAQLVLYGRNVAPDADANPQSPRYEGHGVVMRTSLQGSSDRDMGVGYDQFLGLPWKSVASEQWAW